MAYVITTACMGTKEASCVGVCPVDAIHPRPDEPDFGIVEQLYIDPEGCIDCDACFGECPVNAIYPDRRVPAEFAGSVQANADYYD
ncbi:4Fe-4S dicluster domain-containing protein [Nocardia nepalensis]|uniref:4Fe-4S dicluster domain-containing protein n=1 Tax=Nocardia nepalensis TaxID=3375448 RepID=UPI003B672BED